MKFLNTSCVNIVGFKGMETKKLAQKTQTKNRMNKKKNLSVEA